MLRCRVFDFPLDLAARTSLETFFANKSDKEPHPMILKWLFGLVWLYMKELCLELWEKIVIGQRDWLWLSEDGSIADQSLARHPKEYVIAVGLPNYSGLRRLWRWILPERKALLLAHGRLRGCRVIDYFDDPVQGRMLVITDWSSTPCPPLPAARAMKLLKKMMRAKGFGTVGEGFASTQDAEEALVKSNQHLRAHIALLENELATMLRGTVVLSHRASTPTREELERALSPN
jgi:hypothetical protein